MTYFEINKDSAIKSTGWMHAAYKYLGGDYWITQAMAALVNQEPVF